MLARSMTIVGSCTDQCHTASVLSWSVWEGVQREIWLKRLTECAFITCGHPLDIEVVNGRPSVDSECTCHLLSEQLKRNSTVDSGAWICARA